MHQCMRRNVHSVESRTLGIFYQTGPAVMHTRGSARRWGMPRSRALLPAGRPSAALQGSGEGAAPAAGRGSGGPTRGSQLRPGEAARATRPPAFCWAAFHLRDGRERLGWGEGEGSHGLSQQVGVYTDDLHVGPELRIHAATVCVQLHKLRTYNCACMSYGQGNKERQLTSRLFPDSEKPFLFLRCLTTFEQEEGTTTSRMQQSQRNAPQRTELFVFISGSLQEFLFFEWKIAM